MLYRLSYKVSASIFTLSVMIHQIVQRRCSEEGGGARNRRSSNLLSKQSQLIDRLHFAFINRYREASDRKRGPKYRLQRRCTLSEVQEMLTGLQVMILFLKDGCRLE